MTEDREMVVYEARIGADRMALGLPCIPDKVKGDLDAVAEMRRTLVEYDDLDAEEKQ